MDFLFDPRRKKNSVLEWVAAYTADDDRDVLEEYERLRKTQKSPRRPTNVDT